MRSFSRNFLRRGIGRRCVCAFLLSAYVVTACGIPLPLPGSTRKQAEAFPCVANACGCDSAERCWRSCCCHTLAERIAWARKRGVTPPAFAVAQARAAGINLAWLDGSANAAKTKANCCVAQTSADKACCARELTASVPKTDERSCCSERQDVTAPDDVTPPNDGNILIGLRALACRGQALHWLAAVPTLIMPPHEVLNDLTLVERRAPEVSEVADSVSESPDVPPPKVA
jgi:hypothetical protein